MILLCLIALWGLPQLQVVVDVVVVVVVVVVVTLVVGKHAVHLHMKTVYWIFNCTICLQFDLTLSGKLTVADHFYYMYFHSNHFFPESK